MNRQVPVILDSELVVPFSHLTSTERDFFTMMLGEKDTKLIPIAYKASEKVIPYQTYAYWMDYLQLSLHQPNPLLEV